MKHSALADDRRRVVDGMSDRVTKLRYGMLEDEEDEACATCRIVEAGSGKIVGLLYVWEDGARQPLWFDGVKPHVAFVVLSEPRRKLEQDLHD